MRILSLVVTALSVGSTLGLASIKTGDKVPAVSLDFGFPPQKVFLPEYTSDKKMLIIGLPGAFTPT
jgi:peroxiredoxin